MFPDDIQALARQIIEQASARGLTVSTAESCTGGLVAAALTDVPGSSAVVDRGFVTYSNAAKTAMVGVSADLIEVHGAVSEPVARAMAKGAVEHSDAAISVAITGIAGPSGGSEAKPVGLVHLAACGPSGVVHVEKRFGDLGRTGIRVESVRTALHLLLDRIQA